MALFHSLHGQAENFSVPSIIIIVIIIIIIC